MVRDTLKCADPDLQAWGMACSTRALWRRLSQEQLNALPQNMISCVQACQNRFGPEVDQLVVRAGEFTSRDVFDFGRTSNQLDPRRQKPWVQCDPDGTVKFVVTPGYAVGTRILLAQKIFTTPEDGP